MGGQKAPAGYQPTGQAAADSSYQNMTNYLQQAGTKLADSTIPAYQRVTDAVTNNPYYTQAQAGANQTADIGTNQVAPLQFQAGLNQFNTGNTLANAGIQSYQQNQTNAQTLYGDAQGAQGKANDIYSQIMGAMPGMVGSGAANSDYMTSANKYTGMIDANIPNATAGYGYAASTMQDALSKAGISWDQAQGLIQQLTTGGMGNAQKIMDDAGNPQSQLYDRSYQQMMEHVNASNAQNGVSGSPFAAGVANDAQKNFQIDWANTALDREIKAMGAYNQTTGQAASNYANIEGAGAGAYNNLVNTGVNSFNSLTNGATANLQGLTTSANDMNVNAQQRTFNDSQTAMNNQVNRYTEMVKSGVDAYTAMQATGVSYDQLAQNAQNSGVAGLNTLSNSAAGAYGSASDLGTAGLNTLSTSAQLPNDVYVQNQNQILQALNAQVQGTTGALGPMQTAIGDQGNYMKIGQSATANAQNAAQINNAQSQATMGSIGKLAGLAAAPFTGGLSAGLAAAGGKAGAAIGGSAVGSLFT